MTKTSKTNRNIDLENRTRNRNLIGQSFATLPLQNKVSYDQHLLATSSLNSSLENSGQH